jgi:hypothetical protein
MLSLGAAVALLVLADLLAFHDLFEPHTVRDWLMLAASVLAAIGLAGHWLRGQSGRPSTPRSRPD